MAWSAEARAAASRRKKKYWADVKRGKIRTARRTTTIVSRVSRTKLKNAIKTIALAHAARMI